MCNTWSESFTGGALRGKIVEKGITAVGDRSIENINERTNIKGKWTKGQGPVKQCQTVQHMGDWHPRKRKDWEQKKVDEEKVAKNFSHFLKNDLQI